MIPDSFAFSLFAPVTRPDLQKKSRCSAVVVGDRHRPTIGIRSTGGIASCSAGNFDNSHHRLVR